MAKFSTVHDADDHSAITGVSTGSSIAKCSSALTMTDTVADITGATLTIVPTVAEIWIVDAIFDFRWTTVSAAQVAIGECHFDGVAEAGIATLLGTNLIRATVVQVYRIAATAASHTVKLRAYKSTSGGVCEAQTNSQIRVVRFVA